LNDLQLIYIPYVVSIFLCFSGVYKYFIFTRDRGVKVSQLRSLIPWFESAAVNWLSLSCRNVVFYYGTGVTFGLLASLLVVVFVVSRFIPKVSIMYKLYNVV